MNSYPIRKEPQIRLTPYWGGLTLLLVALYAVWVVWSQALRKDDTFWMTAPILLFAFILCALTAYLHKLSLRSLGWCFGRWQRDLIPALITTGFILSLAIFLKYLLVKDVEASLFSFWGHLEHTHFWVIPAYLIMVPMQVFVFRSCLQAILVNCFCSKKGKLFAVIISSMAYSASHLHISYEIALISLLPGAVWGYLFFKTGSVFASLSSQLVTGLVGFYVIGFHGLTLSETALP